MHIIDIIIVITYFALCILIGLYKSKSIRTLKEYTLGRGHFPNIVIITTVFITHIGAAKLIGSIEKVYVLGMFFVVVLLLSPLFWLIMAKIYSENIEQFRGCMSVSDIMEKLYGKAGRWITNIASILVSIGVVAVQAKAMGYLVNYFFDISYSCSVIVSTLILAVYSLGGIRAVAFTDMFQFAMLMIAIPIAFSFAYHDVGGYRGIVNSLPEDMISLNLNKDNTFLFLSLIFYALLPESAGIYIQRFLICRNYIQLTHCLNFVTVISFFFVSIICLIGFILKIKEPDMDPHIVFIDFITNNIPIVFKGLIIAGLFAVIMSTADSWLNTTSVLFAHDIVRKIIPLTEKQALLVARTFTLLVSIAAIFLAIDKKGLVETAWISANFWITLILIPLTAGFSKFRTNSRSFIAAIIIAILFTSISGYIVEGLNTISVMCGIIGSAIGLLGTHYWQVYLLYRRFCL